MREGTSEPEPKALEGKQDLGDTAEQTGGKIGVPHRSGLQVRGVAQHIVERNDAAHRMTKDDDGKAGVLLGDQVVHGVNVVQDLCASVLRPEHAARCVGRFRVPVATMIVRISMKAMRCHGIGKATVTGGMFGKPVIDLNDAARARRRHAAYTD